MFVETPSFPATLAFGAVAITRYSTGLVSSKARREQRNQRWSHPRHAYEVSLVNRPIADMRDFNAFFRAIGRGMLQGFRFHDFAPGEARGIDEPIGAGDGTTTAYHLTKRYTSGLWSYDRPITKPVAGSVHIYVDAAEVDTADYTLDTTTGIVTFDTAPVANTLITATYQFEVPVRLDLDTFQAARLDHRVFTFDTLRLIEVRV